MQIEKIQTMDFMGLTGKRAWTPEKVNILCQPNRAGKSSFLKALKYAITGEAPLGEMVSAGKDRACVGLDLHHDSGAPAKIIRTKTSGGSTACFLDGRKVTKALVDQAIEESSGVPMKAIRLATSEDALKAVKPQDFEALILSYTDETVDIETLESLIPGMTSAMSETLRKHLHTEEINLPVLDACFKELDTGRLQVKRYVDEKSTMVTQFEKLPKPPVEKEALEEEEKKLQAVMGVAATYRERLDAYEKAKKAREAQEKTLAGYREKIAACKAEKRDEAAYAALKKALEEKNNLLHVQTASVAATKKSIADTENVIRNLNTPYCPLSAQLRCTTDKTKVQAELQSLLKTLKESEEQGTRAMEVIRKEIEEIQKQIRESDEMAEQLRQKEFLMAEVAKLEKQLIEVPKQPENPDVENAEKRMRQVKQYLSDWKTLEKIRKIKGEVERGRTMLTEVLKPLCDALSPKGVVKEKLIARYMSAFEEVCNEKAEKLKPGMQVKFQPGAGVRVLVDPNGSGHFLSYDSLSGAEKALFIYLILDLLNSLSGMRILIIDELSVLDGETFRTLIRLIMDHQDDYDHVFLSFVNHSDTVGVLNDMGLGNTIDLGILPGGEANAAG